MIEHVMGIRPPHPANSADLIPSLGQNWYPKKKSVLPRVYHKYYKDCKCPKGIEDGALYGLDFTKEGIDASAIFYMKIDIDGETQELPLNFGGTLLKAK